MENDSNILNEIFLTPSNITIENRFNEAAADAGCSGICDGPRGCKYVHVNDETSFFL